MRAGVVTIAADGDVILVVSEELGKKQIKLRVRTSSLRSASKVFDALFGSCFAEGQNLSSLKPPKVSLVDDPASMKIICQVLHFQNSQLPDSLSATQVLKLAQTVDKYDLSEAMALALERWLVPSTDTEELILLLEASIVLRDEATLEKMSRSLILHGATPFVDVRKHRFGGNLLSLLYILEQERTNIRTRINSVIFGQAIERSHECGCYRASEYTHDVVDLAWRNKLSPSLVNINTVADSISRIKVVTDAIALRAGDAPPCSQIEYHATPDILRSIWLCYLDEKAMFEDLRLALVDLFRDT